MTKEIVSFLLFVIVVLASGKQIEDRKSRLILEFDWPEPKKNLQRIPHAASCSHFYAIRPSHGQVLKKCPGDELFDYRTLRCQQKTAAKCWSDVLKRGHTKKKAHSFKCPFPWGLYPDLEDCSLFYDCLNGVPYARKCPDNFLFDNAERNCVEAKEAMCADHKDVVEPDYKCPYKWGFFTHSKECSKYYECLRKVPNIRTCKKNMLFDNFQRRCLPAGDVECVNRFNPYERQRVTNDFLTEHQGDTTERKSSRNEWGTNNHMSTQRPEETTNRFYTGRPWETTNNRLSSRHPGGTTNNRLSSRRPGETTNNFFTGRPWETTNNRLSSERPGETTNNRLSSEPPGETTNYRLSSRRPEETTNYRLSSGRPGETMNNRLPTGLSWETTNDRLSTGRPGETTNNRLSSERSGETTNNRLSSERPEVTTNYRFSTGRPWETTNNPLSSRQPGGTTNNRLSSRRPGETTNDRLSTGRTGETTNNRLSTGRPEPIVDYISTKGPGERTDSA